MMNHNLKDKWAVEYNGTQNRFHIQEAPTRIEQNIKDAHSFKKSEWYLIGIADSIEQAKELVDETRSIQGFKNQNNRD